MTINYLVVIFFVFLLRIKKGNMKSTRVFLAAVLFAIGFSCCAKYDYDGNKIVEVTVDGTNFYFALSEYNEATVTYPRNSDYYDGSYYGGHLSIPETFVYKNKDYYVVGIGEEAFSGCEDLHWVRIPNTVSYIGARAFEGCRNLTEIEIPQTVTRLPDGVFEDCGFTSFDVPNSIKEIDGWAFACCHQLESITISESVSSINGWSTFSSCSKLVAINVDPNNTQYKSEDGVLFSKDGNSLVLYPPGMEGDYVVPDGVVVIAEGAFRKNRNINSLSLPSTVTTISEYAFSDCNQLVSISIPSSVSNIGNKVFFGCSQLESIDVDPANVRYSSEDGVLIDEQEHVLMTCPAKKQGAYSVPEGVVEIAESAFICKSLTSVTIPNTVVVIGNFAFSECGFHSITIPASIKKLGWYCFPWELTSLTCLAVTPPMLEDDYGLFNGFNENLREIKVPSSSVAAYKSASGWKEYASIIVGI